MEWDKKKDRAGAAVLDENEIIKNSRGYKASSTG